MRHEQVNAIRWDYIKLNFYLTNIQGTTCETGDRSDAQDSIGTSDIPPKTKRKKSASTAQDSSNVVQTREGKKKASQTHKGKQADTSEIRKGKQADALQTRKGKQADASQTRKGKKADTSQTHKGKQTDASQTHRGKHADALQNRITSSQDPSDAAVSLGAKKQRTTGMMNFRIVALLISIAETANISVVELRKIQGKIFLYYIYIDS